MTPNKHIEKKVDDFIGKFCNDHNGEVRFLRGVFYDEKDGAEQIIFFLRTALLSTYLAGQDSVREEMKKEVLLIRNFYKGDGLIGKRDYFYQQAMDDLFSFLSNTSKLQTKKKKNDPKKTEGMPDERENEPMQ